MYLLDKGHVAIRAATPQGDTATMRVLGPGHWFGEIAVLEGGPRAATVVALDATETLSLHRDVIDAAGISRGTFYLYFDSKDELFLELIERFIRLMTEATPTTSETSRSRPSDNSQTSPLMRSPYLSRIQSSTNRFIPG